jgi:colanic acid biosynthesis protein WcaH
MLPQDEFLKVVEKTPLVSIDLIVQSNKGILLGERKNAPAKGSYFVPGGIIRKNETLYEALERISYDELGMSLSPRLGKLIGVYDHIYEDNSFNDDFGTHYVVIGLMYRLTHRQHILLNASQNFDQHSSYVWKGIRTLLEDPKVHTNVKRYFRRKTLDGFRV